MNRSAQAKQVDEIIAAFGGLTAAAKALGHRHPTTVQGWQKAGRIPTWRRREVIEAAAQASVELPTAYLLSRAA